MTAIIKALKPAANNQNIPVAFDHLQQLHETFTPTNTTRKEPTQNFKQVHFKGHQRVVYNMDLQVTMAAIHSTSQRHIFILWLGSQSQLVALSVIATCHTTPTKATLDKVQHFLDYYVSYAEAVITHWTSNK